MISCARATRAPQKVLVGRAQWEINQPPSLKRERASLEGPLYGGHSTRADEVQRPHPAQRVCFEEALVESKKRLSIKHTYQDL